MAFLLYKLAYNYPCGYGIFETHTSLNCYIIKKQQYETFKMGI